MTTTRPHDYWDLHIHGVAGIDFMSCTQTEMTRACQILGNKGISVFAPTLLTDTPERLLAACERWGQFIQSIASLRPQALGARPLGIHLEGPFLNPKMAGAHPGHLIAAPSLGFMKALIKAAQGHIAIVTLAPEIHGALALVRFLDRQGIRVQMGHSHATTTETQLAVKAGADGITHLFNAMKFHHRAPGFFGALMQNPKLTAELITDGEHVDPSVIMCALRGFPKQLYAVSDGCAATGTAAATTSTTGVTTSTTAKDQCPLTIGRVKPLTLGRVKILRQGRLAVVAQTGTLAGGATFLSDHPRFLLKWFRAHRIKVSPQVLRPLFAPLSCPKLRARI